MDVAERSDLGEKETVIVPGQLYEITAVAEQLESQAPVEGDGALDVRHDDLCHELFCRINVSFHLVASPTTASAGPRASSYRPTVITTFPFLCPSSTYR